MEKLPSWLLKAMVASAGAVTVLLLLRKWRSKAAVAPAPEAPEAPKAVPSEQMAIKAAQAAGLTGLAAQKAAALQGKQAELTGSLEEEPIASNFEGESH